jgi:hypothetical protein
MQTVNFQCGHCGNLMAVAADFLGQQVRCPHCQQVVVAPMPASGASPAQSPSAFSLDPGPAQVLPPGAAPAGPGEPLFTSLPGGDAEDIFSNPAETGDDLFGRPDGPRLEMSREPLPESGPSPAPAPAPGPPTESALTYTAPPDGSGALPVESSITTGPHEGHLGGIGGATLTEAPASAAAPEEMALPSPTVRRPRPSGGGWFLPLVFIPLCLYAVLATVAVVILLMRQQQAQPSIFDQMPDVTGDSPGVKKTSVIKFDQRSATAALPEHLQTDLGQPLQVGDLEVTPLRVERKRVAVWVARAANAEPCPADSLVLHLKLRNLAADYRFTPLDNYFDRRWRQGQGPPPLTVLQGGDHFCFGGPAEWYPRGDGRHPREWLAGRKDFDPEGLAPGKEMQSLVCTDGGKESPSPCARWLFGLNEEGKKVRPPYQGRLLWRVHVRRGLVNWRGKPVPATAVIGVRFTSAAYAGAG